MVGITGGIGSGKSTIAQGMTAYGWTVVDTDALAKQLIVSDPDLRQSVTELLGEEAYQGEVYNTAYVASRVFGDAHLLSRLNALVHPVVARELQAMDNHRLLVECAILYESGLDQLCDKTIAVVAPMDIRVSRTMARDGATQEQVLARIAQQMSDEQRAQRADIIIHNDGKLSIQDICQSLQHNL